MGDWKEEVREAIRTMVEAIIATGIIFIIVLQLFGCTTTKTLTKEVPVEVPVYRHDTVVVRQAAKELRIIKDSIVRMKDTVMFYHTTYIDKAKHDTVYLSKTDTVTVPKIIKQETAVVKNQPSLTGKYIGFIGTVVLLIAIGFACWSLWKRLKPPNVG